MPVSNLIILWILFALSAAVSLLCFAVSLRAVVDVARRDPKMFPLMGKRTKGFWLILCVVCLAFSAGFTWLLLEPFLLYGAPSLAQVHFLQLIAAVVSGVYLADVKPAVS